MVKELRNNSKLVEFPMPLIADGDTLDYDNIPMGYTRKDIVWRRFGSKNYPCVMIKGTEQQRDDCLRLYDSAFRQERREKRCLVYNKKGELIRCPAGNSCEFCEKKDEHGFTTNRPLSLDKLMTGDTDDDATIDVPGSTDLEAEVLGFIVLNDLMEHLESFGEGYDEIFKLLMDKEKVSDMAKRYDVPWSTMKDKVKKVKNLADSFIK